MQEIIHLGIFGACGDDCSLCPRYRATLAGDRNALERVKELWILLGWREADVTAEELKCSGCRKENKCSYQKLRDCAFEKGYKNCGMCGRYPCGLVSAAFEKTENAFRSCNGIGSDEEMEALTKAFRYKKSNLDRIHKFYS